MIGLDFGTTNSCAAIHTPFGVEAVSVANNARSPYDTILRTAVLNPESGTPITGHEAVATASTRKRKSDRYLVSFKPELDRQQLRRQVTREVRDGMIFDPVRQCMLSQTRYEKIWVGGEYTRGELLKSTRLIVSQLLQASQAAGGEPDRVWMGMPVVFSSAARKRLLAALAETFDSTGKPFFSGYRDLMQRVRFVLEPVAVAAGPMREAFDVSERENVLVFDHGGGTLDLSLIEFERRPEFDAPVPVRLLDAFGSRDVAGHAIDLAFREWLERDERFRRATKGYLTHIVDGLVEERKIELSTREAVSDGLLGMPSDRDDFEQAVRPVLDKVEQVVGECLIRGGLTTDQVDRVVLTGGSSLSPCVQARLRRMFGHLDDYRFLAYDAASTSDVESALTEIAKGLVSFGDQVGGDGVFEQVVLWDVELALGPERERISVATRGEPFARSPDGEPELKRVVDIPAVPGEGTSLGLYEDQLGERFVFGVAEVPPLPEGAQLEVHFRPTELVPRLRLLDRSGKPVHGEDGNPAWSRRTPIVGDLLQGLSESELEDYFEQDEEYVKVVNYREFESSPLVRPLKVGDLVEWARDKDGSGPGRDLVRRRGELRQIRHIESGEYVEEMADYCVRDYVFTVVEKENGARYPLRGGEGCLRLSPHPWRDF